MNQAALSILVTGVAVGLAVLGLAIRTMRLEREKEKKAARQETGDAATPPPPAPPPPAPEAAPASPALPGIPADPSIPELARLLRAPDGALIVEMDGRRYRARAEIAEAAVGRQLLAAANDLSRFLRGEPTTTAPASAPAPPPPVTLPARPAVVITAQQAAQTPLVKPSMNPFEQLRYLREREKQPEVKIKSFLEEIDEVLQAKIADTPLIARGVKVTTGPNGAALFWLDDHSYERPDDLPDPEARAVVQAAVREWEKK